MLDFTYKRTRNCPNDIGNKQDGNYVIGGYCLTHFIIYKVTSILFENTTPAVASMIQTEIILVIRYNYCLH